MLILALALGHFAGAVPCLRPRPECPAAINRDFSGAGFNCETLRNFPGHSFVSGRKTPALIMERGFADIFGAVPCLRRRRECPTAINRDFSGAGFNCELSRNFPGHSFVSGRETPALIRERGFADIFDSGADRNPEKRANKQHLKTFIPDSTAGNSAGPTENRYATVPYHDHSNAFVAIII
ncbi:hypothetical protein CEXT_224971 [Caerostris extrusa]|uniref:Uncharacterized protein n=1 Tax=Caerostris extrusa TaxID=172846 RepID=A0AAV4XWE9_CAEEX|nr:hypothetical protein CEXT_224971 [Caerostris extrusa]